MLRDRAAARPAEVAFANRIVDCPRDAHRIDAGVLVEARVLGGDGRVDEVGRDLVQLHRGSPAVVRVGHLVEHLAVPVVDQRRRKTTGALRKFIGGRKVARDACVADHDRAEQQRGDGDQDEESGAKTSAAAPSGWLRGTSPAGGLRCRRVRGRGRDRPPGVRLLRHRLGWRLARCRLLRVRRLLRRRLRRPVRRLALPVRGLRRRWLLRRWLGRLNGTRRWRSAGWRAGKRRLFRRRRSLVRFSLQTLEERRPLGPRQRSPARRAAILDLDVFVAVCHV